MIRWGLGLLACAVLLAGYTDNELPPQVWTISSVERRFGDRLVPAGAIEHH